MSINSSLRSVILEGIAFLPRTAKLACPATHNICCLYVCRFPTPGLLDGITSKEKPICKLSNVTFTYPGAAKPQLTDVNIAARLSSRVAVIGVNGAGKSVSLGLHVRISAVGNVCSHLQLQLFLQATAARCIWLGACAGSGANFWCWL